MTQFNTLNIQNDGRISLLQLNRPESFNSFNIEMIEELVDALNNIKEMDTDILIIYGSGKGFSAGGDIKTMLEQMDKEIFYNIMDKINYIIETVYSMPKLAISAVHGAAAGLGFSLALATDYIIAEESSIFAMNFVKIGLIPDGGGHFFLKNRINQAKARQLIWEGNNLSAEEAFNKGLIDEVTDNNVLENANKRALYWLNMPIKSMIETKLIYANNNKDELKRLLEIEKKSQFKMRNTIDHQEGIEAFLEKRKPNFIGK